MNNLSIVVPVFNEEDNVIQLAQEMELAFQWVDFQWEVIWVDDRSDDKTAENLHAYTLKNPHHKLIRMPERRGQSAAVLSGIRCTRYPLIGTLDGDGQNSPYDLLILKKLLEDTDIYFAQGYRMKRQDSVLRRLSTGVANGFRSWVLKDGFVDVGCAVRVFQRHVVDGLPGFKGWHRFLPVMVHFLHYDKILEHPVSHRERRSGNSKYGVWNRLWVGIYDLIGMLWFKQRMIKLLTQGEVECKTSFMELVSQAKLSLPEEYLSSGLPVSEPVNP